MQLDDDQVREAFGYALQTTLQGVPQLQVRNEQGEMIRTIGQDGSLEYSQTGETKYWLAFAMVTDRAELVEEVKALLQRLD